MPLRRGFTMIELLVVVSVIAVLAGILVPTIGLVRRMANDVKCGNNLQQIAGAIIVFKHDHDDQLPGCLIDTDPSSKRDLVHSGGPLASITKIFLCPHDLKLGKDSSMGRAPKWDTPNSLSYISDLGSSYCYEAGDKPVPPGWLTGFFYGDLDASQQRATATWAEYKHDQRYFGNLLPNGKAGAPFSGTIMPIIRCYWHYQWHGTEAEKTLKKVKNVGWDLNVFNSSPYWEHDANPGIALPTN